MLQALGALKTALASGAESPVDAVERLDAAERAYESFAAKREADGSDPYLLLACQNLLMRWAYRNSRFLPRGRYRAAMERFDATDRTGSQQERFDVSTLPAVTRFIRQLDSVPAPLADQWTALPALQPMAELRVRHIDDLSADGRMKEGDRLIVHIGSVAYAGALIIATRDDGERIRQCAARLLVFEGEAHGPVLRVGEGASGVVLAERGTVTVECVIFNRPDVLPNR